MTDPAPPPPPPNRRLWPLGALLLLAVVALWLWRARAEEGAQRAHEQRVEAEFAPVREQLREAAKEQTARALAAPEAKSYDLDRTIRFIHQIDRAVEGGADLQSWLRASAREDVRGVPAEVLERRNALLAVVQQLHARTREAEEAEQLWAFTGEYLLSALSLVKFDVDVSVEAAVTGGAGKAGVDREQAAKLLEQLLARRAEQTALRREVAAMEGELLTALVDWAGVYAKYVSEWDRLCLQRDRAYLAAETGDWARAAESARAAIALAPDEREAHLLLGLALLEGAREGGEGTSARDEELSALLRDQLERHPEATAPVLLLQGAHAAERDPAEATLLLQQAAAYYPRQASRLAELLDPYRTRAWLRRSREGGRILERYQAMMLGAGEFSPDLRLAQLHFSRGELEQGRSKVRDHFARRRAQQEWGFLLSDVQFCERTLGPHWRSIFPEEAWLDLKVSPALLSDAVKLEVKNRSARTLHNASLVLLVQFTDMLPDDYEAIAAERTVPAVVAHEVTDFGERRLETKLWGQLQKGVRDVVRHRAILVSDEAVVRVETDEFKLAEAAEFRAARRTQARLDATTPPPPRAREANDFFRITGLGPENVGALVRSAAKLAVDPRLGRDDVKVSLPRELAIFQPALRLLADGKPLPPAEDVIRESTIELRFDSVADLELAGEGPPELELQFDSRLVSFRAFFQREATGGFGLARIEGLPPPPP